MVKIGLEVHVQLSTLSKLFCHCPVSEAEPNSLVCEVCLGMPGSKPVLNKKAVEYAIMLASALNCKINREFFFSRKIYFYPDLAKNYQITQYESPIGESGFIDVDGEKIRIKRVHLEEDPASLIHESNTDYCLVDYNRSGVPLCEIVTEPDIKSPLQARKFLDKFLNIISYLGIYDQSIGVLKVDCNISIDGGERVEIKNVTGFRAVEDAFEAELLRQISEKNAGNKIERETRGFDASLKSTYSLRKKETEEDYGYIFDPDLPKIEISQDWLEKIKASIPELPEQKALRFMKQYGLKEYDAKVLVGDKLISEIFEDCAKIDVKIATKIISRELLGVLNYNSLQLSSTKITSSGIAGLVKLLSLGKVSEKNAKESLIKYALDGVEPEHYLSSNNLLMDSSVVDISSAVKSVVEENKSAFSDFKSGSSKALNFLIGAVMKKLRGKADARIVRKEIEKFK